LRKESPTEARHLERFTPEERRAAFACPLFRDHSRQETEALLEMAEIIDFRRRERLFHQGEPVRGLFLLLAGRVKLAQLGPQGGEVIIRVVAPGEIFAAVAALERAGDLPVGAQALTDGRAVVWWRPGAQEIVRRDPRLSAALMLEISSRAQEFQSRLREVATERVPLRLAHTLLRLAEQAGEPHPDGGRLIDFPLTRQDLASMVGTTLYTTSRVLNEWSEKGLLELGRSRIVVIDPAGLEETAAAETPGGAE